MKQQDLKRMTKSERFIEEKKEYWITLEKIIKRAHNGNIGSLSKEEIREFPNLYRKVCTDSELAKTLELSPDTIDYLSRLVQYGHNILYLPPKKELRDLKNFFTEDFTAAFAKNIRPIAAVFFLFFGVLIITFILIYRDPRLASSILPEELIDLMKKSYSGDVSDKRNFFDNIVMSGYYIRNNISIGFSSFVLGITYGLGTLLTVLSNAISIGGVFGLVVSSGYGKNLTHFVTAHAAFELLGLCLTGGSGLALGLSMVYASEEKKTTAISRKARELVPVLFTGALFILCAAFIEGFVSPSKLPYWVKLLVLLVTGALVFFFAFRYFLRRRK
jgi:uncharacterized membrane protein SpoIIM required for sporulation